MRTRKRFSALAFQSSVPSVTRPGCGTKPSKYAIPNKLMGNAHHVCNQGVLKVADKACLANPNKTATILTLVGWGNEDQEEV